MDCNVPSGESFVRQFLYGQRYFEKHFGSRHKVFWLPDTFGYSSQLPQIVKQSGAEYFFTQKLSWNNINKFPHSTFIWVGLDGTPVLTHFCPADTYCAQVSVAEVVFTVKNNKDKEYSDRSLMLFGNGDGGGGPLAPMLERLKRLESISGLPAKMRMGEPTEFYSELESRSRDLVTWKGELYFELHRGTYTTHAQVKKYNRQCEYLLRSVEMLSTFAKLKNPAFEYPKSRLDFLWKLVLLNQFHDVLPGSSIELVYFDARAYYKQVVEVGTELLNTAIKALNAGKDQLTFFNPTSWNYSPSVVEVAASNASLGRVQFISGDKCLVIAANTPQLGTATFDLAVSESFGSVNVLKSGAVGWIVENQFVRVGVDDKGRLTSMYDIANERECIPAGSFGNFFRMYEDVPLYWDAWDVEIYHLEKGWDCEVGGVVLKESGPLRVVLTATHPISPTSLLVQDIILTATSGQVEFHTTVQWNENRKILKVEFPVDVSSDYATYETAFGFEQRPTHANTSWDMAKFETCAHKFVDVSEHGFGIALFNDCKYGHAVHQNKTGNGCVMRTSLLRSPKAPDEHCDIHNHTFKYALYPHSGTFHQSDVVQKGYQFNVPLLVLAHALNVEKSLFAFECDHVVLDTIKMSEEDFENAFIIRFYEACGGRSKVNVSTSLVIKKICHCNLLEDDADAVAISNGVFSFEIKPFQIMSFKVTF